MSTKLNLVLIFGGKSGEHDVSLMSARSVLKAVNRDKYNIFQVGITRQGRWTYGANTLDNFEQGTQDSLNDALITTKVERPALYEVVDGTLQKITQIDVVFPILHGTFGEDGTIQGLFEIQNCAYVGAGVLASSLAMDKSLCKDLIAAAGIPVLEYKTFNRKQIEPNLAEVVKEAEQISPYPLFVKPANLGSSVGINKAKNRQELEEALRFAALYDRRILVERGIEAREIELSVLGNEDPIVSQPGEIVPGEEFYTYQDKYLSGDPEVAIPAPLPLELQAKIQAWAIQAFKAIDGAGLSRVDFLLDKKDGKVYFNEINTMPGFTQISMFSKLLAYDGLPYSKLIDRLIELAMDRKAEQAITIRSFEVGNGR